MPRMFCHLGEFCGIVFPKEQCLEEKPNLGISPMFAEDIRRVVFSLNMIEVYHTACNGLSNSVEGEGCVSFM